MDQKKQVNQKKRQYHKVPCNKRQDLIQQVFKKNQKINVAAQKLQINYAAAKSIIEKQRKKQIKKFKIPVLSQKQCSYKSIEESSNVSYNIIVQQFGEILKKSMYINHSLYNS